MTSRMFSSPRRSPPDGRFQRRSPRGWRAVLKGPEQEAEPVLRLLVADAQRAKDARLDVRSVDAHRPAAEFPAVEDQVVGLERTFKGSVSMSSRSSG